MPRRRPRATPGQRHVRQGVGDQGQAARHEEHADARADDGRHGAGDERPLHEGVLEKLRPHHAMLVRHEPDRGAVEGRQSGASVMKSAGGPW